MPVNPPATSNYDRMRDAMEREFLRYDQARMIDKFSLAHDPSYLYLNFVGRHAAALIFYRKSSGWSRL